MSFTMKGIRSGLRKIAGLDMDKISEEEEKAGRRVVTLNDPYENAKYKFVSNRVTNTKYTLLNFIPKTLLEQFSRMINRYFLLLAFLQLWDVITPVNPVSTWVPLLIIVGVGVFKEALDDYFRRRSDARVNSKPVNVLRDGSLKTIPAEDVRVGDIVYVSEDEEIPCDLVLLMTQTTTKPVASSGSLAVDDMERHEKDQISLTEGVQRKRRGIAYLETANIDGETTLKELHALAHTSGMQPEDLASIKAVIECEFPNPHIYKFDSSISILSSNATTSDSSSSSSSYQSHSTGLSAYQRFPLTSEQLLLQGTHLRNTAWAYGVAVYTGNQTKLGKNKHVPHIKWTRTDQFINKLTVFIFIFQLCVMCITGITGDALKLRMKGTSYLAFPVREPWYDPIIIPLRFLLLCSLMIPISLKVTLDIAKYLYALFINWDVQLYDQSSDTPAHAANTSISEDLGQIEYIFTDKTGTLTENVMIFTKCSIASRVWDVKDLRIPVHEDDSQVIDFLTCLAVCNTVTPIQIDGQRQYRASSPDEEALVKGCDEHAGITLLERIDEHIITLRTPKAVTFEILNVLSFTSNRKRMSVIARNRQTNELRLICKGADDVILPRIRNHDSTHRKTTEHHLEEFSQTGLRTLCVASRSLSQQAYNEWKAKYEIANVELRDRQQRLAEVYELIECDLELLGATAIEDKLQDGVPETIKALRTAGIIIWMLTGDKMETALQIALSCNLTSPESRMITIRGTSAIEVRDSIMHAMDETAAANEVGLVIEGHTLELALNSGSHNTAAFIELCQRAHSVICCRTTPSQKAQVVRVMKGVEGKPSRRRCLAVGDGGNDVNMLQEADIGVGIAGKEGLQAARAGDYSIGCFKFLRRLILVHGRLSYYRTAFIAQYSFYKSLLIAFNQILFGFVSAFSGSSLFNTFQLTFFNLIFTSAPPVLYVLDKDIIERELEANPQIYKYARENTYINIRTFIMWFLRAAYQAAAVFIGTMFLSQTIVWGPPGSPIDYRSINFVHYTSILGILTCTVALHTSYWTILNHIVTWGSFIVYFAFTIFVTAVPWFQSSDMFDSLPILLSQPMFYFVVLFNVVVAVLPVYLMKFFNVPPFFDHRYAAKTTQRRNSDSSQSETTRQSTISHSLNITDADLTDEEVYHSSLDERTALTRTTRRLTK